MPRDPRRGYKSPKQRPHAPYRVGLPSFLRGIGINFKPGKSQPARPASFTGHGIESLDYTECPCGTEGLAKGEHRGIYGGHPRTSPLDRRRPPHSLRCGKDGSSGEGTGESRFYTRRQRLAIAGERQKRPQERNLPNGHKQRRKRPLRRDKIQPPDDHQEWQKASLDEMDLGHASRPNENRSCSWHR
jgi:hypothetical protein